MLTREVTSKSRTVKNETIPSMGSGIRDRFRIPIPNLEPESRTLDSLGGTSSSVWGKFQVKLLYSCVQRSGVRWFHHWLWLSIPFPFLSILSHSLCLCDLCWSQWSLKLFSLRVCCWYDIMTEWMQLELTTCHQQRHLSSKLLQPYSVYVDSSVQELISPTDFNNLIAA